MPYVTRCLLVITAIFSLLGPPAASAISIYDIIMLSQNKYEAENIVDIILTTGSAFTLTAADVVYLKTAGINDSVVQTMLVAVPPAESQAAQADSTADWLNVTLEDLLLLADNAVSDAVILSFIRTRERSFSVGASVITRLREAGLSDVAIEYLLLAESDATDGPVVFYPPTVSIDDYPPIVWMEPYPETLTSNRYPSVDPFYDYPSYYYRPPVFVGFVGIRHKLHDHQHVGLHHSSEEHHVGPHHDSDHHDGQHDTGNGQHSGLHHMTPEHIPKYHSASDSNTHETSIDKSHSMTNRNSVIEQSDHGLTETNRPGISRSDKNKILVGSIRAINRNTAHADGQSPTLPSTTLYTVKGSSARSTSRNLTHSRRQVSASVKPRPSPALPVAVRSPRPARIVTTGAKGGDGQASRGQGRRER